MYSAVVIQKVLQRRQEPWGWGADSETDIRSWQQPIESSHQSWSSHNYVRSYWRNQHRPFYCHSAFEANWKGEKAWLVNASSVDHKSKKLSFWSVVFSYFMQQQWIVSWLVCDMRHKVDFIHLAKISSVVRLRRSKALSKAKLVPKKGHGHCLVICCLSDPLQLSKSRWNHSIWEVCSAKQWDTLKTATPSASTGQQKGPNCTWQQVAHF